MSYQYPFVDAEEKTKLEVWAKGANIIQNGESFDPRVWRKDICGDIMKYGEHGNTESEYGWEIDHKKPTSLGGNDALDNLQPLQWKNNRSKGDTHPWRC